jgi:ABC-type arginine transport system permease subunit
MEQDLLEKLNQMEKKVEETRVLAQKTYKLFLWTMIATVVMFVLPLIALAFVIPYFMRTITSGLNGL